MVVIDAKLGHEERRWSEVGGDKERPYLYSPSEMTVDPRSPPFLCKSFFFLQVSPFPLFKYVKKEKKNPTLSKVTHLITSLEEFARIVPQFIRQFYEYLVWSGTICMITLVFSRFSHRKYSAHSIVFSEEEPQVLGSEGRNANTGRA